MRALKKNKKKYAMTVCMYRVSNAEDGPSVYDPTDGAMDGLGRDAKIRLCNEDKSFSITGSESRDEADRLWHDSLQKPDIHRETSHDGVLTIAVKLPKEYAGFCGLSLK